MLHAPFRAEGAAAINKQPLPANPRHRKPVPATSQRSTAVKADPALERYLKEAVSWDSDRPAQTKRANGLHGWVAGAGWLCAIASPSLAVLTPLKVSNRS